MPPSPRSLATSHTGTGERAPADPARGGRPPPPPGVPAAAGGRRVPRAEARSGREALRAAGGGPGAIVLDLGLPDRPGLEVCRALREHPATRNAVIVALTGRAGAAEQRACLEAGCTLYFAKPIEPRELLRRLSGFVP